MKNIDWIKSLSIEDMSEFLFNDRCDICAEKNPYHCSGNCKENSIEWLEQEHEEKLKNCPFCGSDDIEVNAIVSFDMFDGDGHIKGYKIRCLNCMSETGTADTEQAAREHWNERFEEC